MAGGVGRGLVLLPLLLAAAAAHAATPDHVEAWRAEVEALGLSPDDAVYPFETTEEMRQWAEDAVARCGTHPLIKLRCLQSALLDPLRMGFAYRDATPLAAPEAYEELRGNCFAFTSLFVALSRSVGVPMQLGSVERAVEVSRQGDLVVLARHVVAVLERGGEQHIYDFDVTATGPTVRFASVDDLEASGMYHINVGGGLLQAGDAEGALVHLELATRLAPGRAAGWVDLAVARRRTGDLDGTWQALERALREDPDNTAALANLSQLHEAAGRSEEAVAALRAAAPGSSNPHALVALADAELAVGNPKAARRALRRARLLAPRDPHVQRALVRFLEATGREAEAARRRARLERRQQRDSRAHGGEDRAVTHP